jgi:hypothetical protein
MSYDYPPYGEDASEHDDPPAGRPVVGERRRLRVSWEGWHYWRSWHHVRRGRPRYRSYIIGPLRFWLARRETRDD